MTNNSIVLMRMCLVLSVLHVAIACVGAFFFDLSWTLIIAALLNGAFWVFIMMQRDCITAPKLIESLGRQQTLAIWIIGTLVLLGFVGIVFSQVPNKRFSFLILGVSLSYVVAAKASYWRGVLRGLPGS